MNRIFIGFGVGIAAMALAGLSVVVAQPTPIAMPIEPTAIPQPVELTCDSAELARQQNELAAMLTELKLDNPEDAGVTLDNLFKVGAAYQELALNCGYIPADAATRTVGSDVARILNTMETVYGDPLNGQLLYDGELGCAGCHLSDQKIAPPTEGTYTRIEETRLQDPTLADYSIEQYIVESIVQPAHYVVPGYQNIMLNNFGERVTLQELADLVAFLESQDGPSPE
ncbi:MAG: hypothetical protein R3E39_20155 [Anaerolineae bacterium]